MVQEKNDSGLTVSSTVPDLLQQSSAAADEADFGMNSILSAYTQSSIKTPLIFFYNPTLFPRFITSFPTLALFWKD